VTTAEGERAGHPAPIDPAEELERELYWAAPPVASGAPGAVALVPDSELAVRWSELESTLRRDYGVIYPPGEEVLEEGHGWRRGLKRRIFRVIRPLERRYDRIGGDTARLGFETAQEVSATQRELDTLRETVHAMTAELRTLQVMTHEHDVRIGTAASRLEALAGRLESASAAGAIAPAAGASAPSGTGVTSTTSAPMPDAFYWRFEAAMRGSATSIEEKLRQYEPLANELREALGGSPLWIDLGCGEGMFASLLARWGWRVLGMDISQQAVDACREQGIEAVVGALPGYLAEYRGEAPGALSAIQVIEHLPARDWLATFQFAHEVLAPGGAFLIETIDPRNVFALANWFFGDITHTWPANPNTLEVMAGFAGFDRVEVRSINPDAEGEAQDFALVARKAS
jgi:O-antigen chain-terminating methyltransferase